MITDLTQDISSALAQFMLQNYLCKRKDKESDLSQLMAYRIYVIYFLLYYLFPIML